MARDAVDPAQRQVGQRTHIEIDHRELLGAFDLRRRPVQAEARVVHDVLRLEPAPEQFVRDARRGVGALQVDRNDVGLVLVGGAELARQQDHFLLAPRDQRNLVAIGGEDARQLGADSRWRRR